MLITKEIYEIVSQKSRFLRFDTNKQGWEEIGVMAGRDKIGHALRFSARATRRKAKKNEKTHKRSSSLSSTSSASSSGGHSIGGFGWSAIADVVESAPSTKEAVTKLPRTLHKQLTSTLTGDELQAFLYDIFKETGATSKVMQTTPKTDISTVLASDVDDISEFIKSIGLSPQYEEKKATVATEMGSLLSLLHEPIGVWGDEPNENDLNFSEMLTA